MNQQQEMGLQEKNAIIEEASTRLTNAVRDFWIAFAPEKNFHAYGVSKLATEAEEALADFYLAVGRFGGSGLVRSGQYVMQETGIEPFFATFLERRAVEILTSRLNGLEERTPKNTAIVAAQQQTTGDAAKEVMDPEKGE